MLREMRFSFMSGHTSYSFYMATFLIFYLQARLNTLKNDGPEWVYYTRMILKIFRPFIQLGLLILAFWISLTRIRWATAKITICYYIVHCQVTTTTTLRT